MIFLPETKNSNYVEFIGATNNIPGNSAFADIYSWSKPKEASMVYILMIASGGGGAGGRTATSGGGGGSGGGMSKLLIPASQLPSTIYIQACSGSPGGLASSDGASFMAGFFAIVDTPLNDLLTSNANTVLYTNTGQSGQTSGSVIIGGNAADNSFSIYANFGFWTSITGGTSSSSLTGSSGSNVSYGNFGAPTCGGAGASGVAGGNGGNILSTNPYIIPSLPGGIGNAVGVGGNGASNVNISDMKLVTGGSGGGSGLTSSGNGADGAIGCGGGGGALGTTPGTGGAGGPSYVMIAWW